MLKCQQSLAILTFMSRINFGILCIYKNKGADQLRGTAQLISTFVFAAKSSTVPLCPPKIQASTMPYLVAEQAGRTWS